MLAHEALHRAGEVAAWLARQGAPVVVHVDRRASKAEMRAFEEAVQGQGDITLIRRRRCDWGSWSLVDATNRAARRLLRDYPDVTHVCLVSGACLPLRPLSDLTAFLADDPRADYIESVSVSEVPWIQGGLGAERFEYRFPFAFRGRRRLFDLAVRVQRTLGWKRRPPAGVDPHLGSQWWCLGRETLTAILDDPERPRIDRFFRATWIPDESYYQTLARRHSRRLVSRSLTHARFDWKGRPHILYDDHAEQLEQVDAFFARKVWHGADALYARFLSPAPRRAQVSPRIMPDIWGIARRSSVSGRTGLVNSGRFPWWGYAGPATARPYLVFSGFDEVYEDFDAWLARHAPGVVAHGRLFHEDGARFAGGGAMHASGLSAAPALRDYNPEGFLQNLIRFETATQAFHLSPEDRADPWGMIAGDRHAQVFAIRGGFLRGLSRRSGVSLREVAARSQERDERTFARLDDPACRAAVRAWALSDVARDPVTPIRAVLAALGQPHTGPIDMPRVGGFEAFDAFLADLANAGITPRAAGDASVWRRMAGRHAHDMADHG